MLNTRKPEIDNDENMLLEVLEKTAFLKQIRGLGFAMTLNALVRLPVKKVKLCADMLIDDPELLVLLFEMSQAKKRINAAS